MKSRPAKWKINLYLLLSPPPTLAAAAAIIIISSSDLISPLWMRAFDRPRISGKVANNSVDGLKDAPKITWGTGRSGVRGTGNGEKVADCEFFWSQKKE